MEEEVLKTEVLDEEPIVEKQSFSDAKKTPILEDKKDDFLNVGGEDKPILEDKKTELKVEEKPKPLLEEKTE